MPSLARSLVAEHAVADVEDLNAAISDESIEPSVRQRLAEVRLRRLAEVPGVSISTAARVLDLSAQTVRSWITAGVLDAIPGSRPLQVSTKRLAEVAPLVHRLRQAGQDRDLLRAVIDRFEDERVLTNPKVQRSLDELHRGEIEPFSAEEF